MRSASPSARRSSPSGTKTRGGGEAQISIDCPDRFAAIGGGPGRAGETIVLASTTSVENSGFLAHILPEFTKETGITVRVLAQGTGRALATAAHGDADLVLVRDPEAEQQFIANGDGVDRRQIAWNDFIVVGPRSDPARIAGDRDTAAAFAAIAAAGKRFGAADRVPGIASCSAAGAICVAQAGQKADPARAAAGIRRMSVEGRGPR